jgi:starch phosphorylase
MRRSIAALAPRFSATRMVRDYVEQTYLPAAAALRRRLAEDGAPARDLRRWERRLRRAWKGLHIGAAEVTATEDGWAFHVPVYLGEIAADDVRVALYADPVGDGAPETVPLTRGTPIAGAVNGYGYGGRVATRRPAGDYTARVVPYHPDARLPVELPLIRWPA